MKALKKSTSHSTVDGLSMIIPPSSWPTLSKVRGKFRDKNRSDQHFNLVRVDIGDRMFIVDNFFDNIECRLWIAHAETSGFEVSHHIETKEFAYRNQGRFSMSDSSIAAALFSRIQPLLLSTDKIAIDGYIPIGCNSNLRLYRYSAGQRFGKHVDESVEIEMQLPELSSTKTASDSSNESRIGSSKSKRPTGAIAPSIFTPSLGYTKFTVLIYLSGNDDLVMENESSGRTVTVVGAAHIESGAVSLGDDLTVRGGHTIFYGRGGNVVASVAPRTGRLLVHEHGSRCLLHEGAEVTAGIKYVLRTDIVCMKPR